MEDKNFTELFFYAPQDFQTSCWCFILAKLTSLLVIFSMFWYIDTTPYFLGLYGLFIVLSLFFAIKNLKNQKENIDYVKT